MGEPAAKPSETNSPTCVFSCGAVFIMVPFIQFSMKPRERSFDTMEKIVKAIHRSSDSLCVLIVRDKVIQQM